PILEVLKRRKLKNTAVVITRYFGGVKLGAGGLIRAYGGATAQAIDVTGIVKHQLMQKYTMIVDYTLIGRLENELRQSIYILHDIDYQEKVTFTILVTIEETDNFEKWIIDLTSDQADIQQTGTTYIEIDQLD